jgi:arginase
MSTIKEINFIGFASGMGAEDRRTMDGPLVIQQSSYLADMAKDGLTLHWQPMISSVQSESIPRSTLVLQLCQTLAEEVYTLSKNKKFFTVIGGDHSSAIGTWSGAYHALNKQGDMGLIWIDAHMDSHTPETSPTGNIHGMPLAALLGYGDPAFVNILDAQPKLKPEHLCLIGIRSFEEGEEELLKKLNVRIFYIEEVKERGLNVVMQEALKIASHGTIGFGISIDIDGIDPIDAPGTGTDVPNGISAD